MKKKEEKTRIGVYCAESMHDKAQWITLTMTNRKRERERKPTKVSDKICTETNLHEYGNLFHCLDSRSIERTEREREREMEITEILLLLLLLFVVVVVFFMNTLWKIYFHTINDVRDFLFDFKQKKKKTKKNMLKEKGEKTSNIGMFIFRNTRNCFVVVIVVVVIIYFVDLKSKQKERRGEKKTCTSSKKSKKYSLCCKRSGSSEKKRIYEQKINPFIVCKVRCVFVCVCLCVCRKRNNTIN